MINLSIKKLEIKIIKPTITSHSAYVATDTESNGAKIDRIREVSTDNYTAGA